MCAFSRNQEVLEELDGEGVAPGKNGGGKAGAAARRAPLSKRARGVEPETAAKKDKEDGGRVSATTTAARKGSAAAGLARFRRRHAADDVMDPERARAAAGILRWACEWNPPCVTCRCVCLRDS